MNLSLQWFEVISNVTPGPKMTFVFFLFQGYHQLGAGRIWRIICARQEMFVLQMCSVMERVWWSFSVERTWSTHCADWIGLSSVHIKARLPTSVSTRRGALPTGIGRVLAPDPGVAIHLPTITEDLPRHATSHLHAMLCRAIAHPPGGTLHSTIAHRHVITGKKASHL